MSLVIRLRRGGRVKAPFYSVVAADKKFKRDGRFLEKLGFYDPIRKNASLKKDRIEYWKSKGARLTPRVQSLLKDQPKEESNHA